MILFQHRDRLLTSRKMAMNRAFYITFPTFCVLFFEKCIFTYVSFNIKERLISLPPCYIETSPSASVEFSRPLYIHSQTSRGRHQPFFSLSLEMTQDIERSCAGNGNYTRNGGDEEEERERWLSGNWPQASKTRREHGRPTGVAHCRPNHPRYVNLLTVAFNCT